MNPTEDWKPFWTRRKLPQPSDPTPADHRILHAVEEYLSELRDGHKPDPAVFRARYPELPPNLAECLEGLEFVHRTERYGSYPPRQVGDFRLVRLVGRGGMGVVYEAVQASLGRRVALKVLPLAAALDPRQLERFKLEAQAVAQMEHANIVPVYGVGSDQGIHFYAMQFIEGHNLAAVVTALRKQAGLHDSNRYEHAHDITKPLTGEAVHAVQPPTEPRTAPVGSGVPIPLLKLAADRPAYFRAVADLGAKIADALAHAHDKGIVHRDVKPGNLLIDAAGHVWLTDFGLAHCRAGPNLTQSGALLGTLRYMSPEQAHGRQGNVDHRTDVYSLGATLYELLTLRHAFDGDDRKDLLNQVAYDEPTAPCRLDPTVPAELEVIVQKAMAKRPEDRYDSAAALADDLRCFLADRPIRARAPSPLLRTRKWLRRHQDQSVIALVCLLLLAGSLFIVTAAARYAGEKANESTATQSATLLDRLRAARLERRPGFREPLFDLVRAAPPDVPRDALRREAALGLGDWSGLAPRLLEFPADVRALAVSPDGTRLVVGLSDTSLALRELPTGREVQRLTGHAAAVVALHYTTDGKRLVSGDLAGSVHVWHQVGGAWQKAHALVVDPPLADLPDCPQALSLALPDDGTRLAVCSRGASEVKVWNLATGESVPRRLQAGAGRRLGCVAISPDGKTVVAGFRAADGAAGLLVWDLAAPEPHSARVMKMQAVRDVRFSPTGDLMICCLGGGFQLVRLAGGRSMPGIQRVNGDSAFFGLDQRLFAPGKGGTLQAWDTVFAPEMSVDRVRLLAELKHPAVKADSEPAGPAAGDATGQRIALAAKHIVAFWDLHAVEKLILPGHARGVTALAASIDGKLLASAGRDGTVRVWHAGTGKLMQVLVAEKKPVRAVTFAADGTTLAVLAEDGRLRLFDGATWKELASVATDVAPATAAAFGPDGLLVVAGQRGIQTWRVTVKREAGERRATLAPAQRPTLAPVDSLALRPDGQRLAWVSSETVFLWDMANDRALPPLGAGAVRPAGLTFTPDGERIVVLEKNGRAETWSLADNKPIRTLGGDHAFVEGAAALSRDGNWLAGSGSATEVHIWDMQKGTPLVPLPHMHIVPVTALAWLPDCHRLAAGGDDGGIVIWDLARVRARLHELGLGWSR